MSTIAHPAPRRLASFALASVPGNERVALDQVAASVAALNLAPDRLNRLKTAVAEATMNAIEHGNGGRPDLAVGIEEDRASHVVLEGEAEALLATSEGIDASSLGRDAGVVCCPLGAVFADGHQDLTPPG